MPGIVRLSTKELNELIEVTEAAEGDATELKRLLAEVTEDERPRKPESRREWPLAAREGGMTTEEHVEALRQQSFIEYGNDLECMVCHNKVTTLVSGTCENCFREWALTIKRRQPARRSRGVELRAELTTEERLSAEAGYLFPGGVLGDILAMCIEYDAKYSLKELRKMCIDAGLSPSGHKKLLAAKLIAHQWDSGVEKGRAEQPVLFEF